MAGLLAEFWAGAEGLQLVRDRIVSRDNDSSFLVMLSCTSF